MKNAQEAGEIQVFGEGVMLGYLNNEKANKETFTSDGWLRTGDIGYFDQDGLIFVSDRMKELIKVILRIQTFVLSLAELDQQ